MKIKAVSQRTARFNIQRNPEKCWYLLRNLSFKLFDHKKIPELFQEFSKISSKFQDSFQIPGPSQDFPGLVGTMKKLNQAIGLLLLLKVKHFTSQDLFLFLNVSYRFLHGHFCNLTNEISHINKQPPKRRCFFLTTFS